MLRELEDEKYTLSESLHKLETTARKDRERYQQELEEEKNRILRRYEQNTELVELMVAEFNTSYQLQIAQFELNVVTAREEIDTFHAKYKMGEARLKALVMKHREKLNEKIEGALAQGWNEWAAQATKLQVFRADAENRKKEGRGFYKMDKNNIQILHEDLTTEFQALAQTHATC